MDRRLLDYLPPVLRGVEEYRAVNGANEPELALAWEALALVLADQFLETADGRGVSVWERELELTPRDTDTLALRKARIKAKWNLETPYTLPWLRRWLTGICGPEGHEVGVEDYTLHIKLDYAKLPEADRLTRELLELLLTVLPCDMRVALAARLESQGGARLGAASETAQELEVYPRIVSGLETTGGWKGGACAEYVSRVELWPRVVSGMESGGACAAAGALEYHAALEIEPIGGRKNAQRI